MRIATMMIPEVIMNHGGMTAPLDAAVRRPRRGWRTGYPWMPFVMTEWCTRAESLSHARTTLRWRRALRARTLKADRGDEHGWTGYSLSPATPV